MFSWWLVLHCTVCTKYVTDFETIVKYKKIVFAVFPDVSLPSYQEGELDFESLHFQEGEGNGKSNGERLPPLTEVEEGDNPDKEEETRCVSMGMSEEEPHCRRSGFPQDEDWGHIVDLGGQESWGRTGDQC